MLPNKTPPSFEPDEPTSFLDTRSAGAALDRDEVRVRIGWRVPGPGETHEDVAHCIPDEIDPGIAAEPANLLSGDWPFLVLRSGVSALAPHFVGGARAQYAPA